MQKKDVGLLTRLFRFFSLSIAFAVMAAILCSPILLIAGAAYLGGLYFGNKDSKIKADGIAATATVYDVGRDHLGALLQGNADNKMNKTGAQRNDMTQCTIYYRFVAQDGQQIEGSYNREYESLEAAKVEIGNELQVVYSAADPSVFETAIGHTESQTDAMYWIAIAFVVIWLLSAIGLTLQQQIKMLTKSRQKRIDKLKKQLKRTA